MSDFPMQLRTLEEDQKPDHEAEAQNMKTQKRLCDFCGETSALLYCRADSAKLCFSCDREVHSTNQLFAKHTRSLLCDACDSSPVSILCSTENSVLCQNCDWERHSRALFPAHERRPLEGFSGCPSASEFLSIVGFDDLGSKGLLLGDEDGDVFVRSGLYGFSEMLVWDTPSVMSLDDLIVCADSGHDCQALGVPPLPKDRNAACGQHKEEMFRQLRELVKLDPGFNYGDEHVEPFIGFRSVVAEQNLLSGNMYGRCENEAEAVLFPQTEGNALQWCSDTGEAANEVFLPSTFRSSIEESLTVPDIHSDIGGSASHAGDQSQQPIITTTLPVLRVAPYDVVSQDRGSAISRYKEKKKTRRYDKHIRYESRKTRAESRTRIKGRFAKIDR